MNDGLPTNTSLSIDLTWSMNSTFKFDYLVFYHVTGHLHVTPSALHRLLSRTSRGTCITFCIDHK